MKEFKVYQNEKDIIIGLAESGSILFKLNIWVLIILVLLNYL